MTSSSNNSGLGRGLDILLRGTGLSDEQSELIFLPISSIRPSPFQPRQQFADAALGELAESIKAQGVLQPILVRPLSGDPKYEYQLIAGERRLRAAAMAALEEIPALLRDIDNENSLVIGLIENLQREDLNPVEEARALQKLIADFGFSQDEVAQKIGRSRPAVSNSLRLLQLPEKILEELAQGLLTAGHARAILSLPGEALQLELMERIRLSGLSVRETEEMAAYAKREGHLPEEPGVPEEVKPALASPARKEPPPEEFKRTGERLSDILGMRVTISGAPQKGKLTVHFKDEKSFLELVKLLDGTSWSNE